MPIPSHLLLLAAGRAAPPAPPVSGVSMWYDASYAPSITASSGAVSQWNDLSGNAHHLTQTSSNRPTTGTRAINGVNAIDFDGTDDHMVTSTGPNITAMTIFIVMQQDVTAPASQGLLTLLPGSQTANDLNGVMVELRTNKYALAWGEGSTSSSAGDYVAQHQTSGTADTADHLIRVAADSSARTHHVDNAATTLTTFSSSGTTTFLSGLGSTQLLLRIGCRGSVTYPYDGLVGEVLIYPSVLSGGDITTVESYLKTKWGTP